MVLKDVCQCLPSCLFIGETCCVFSQGKLLFISLFYYLFIVYIKGSSLRRTKKKKKWGEDRKNTAP